MSLRSEVEEEIKAIFKAAWSQRNGTVVPTDDSVGLGNDGVNIDATVLYADLADSTVLVDTYSNEFAAEIYKAFLRCAARIIRSNEGAITAYDGDRVMAVFIGDQKNSSAARTGLQIHWAVAKIIQPAIAVHYPNAAYTLKHVVGIDASNLLVAKTGIRGGNDLVWVGRAANHAAKLCALGDSHPTWITKAVYDRLNDRSKYANGRGMWEKRIWKAMNEKIIYRSSYLWAL